MTSDSVAQDQLRAFIDRLERMHEERKAIAADISEIYAEAKGNGFDVPAIKTVLKLRGMDQSERMEREAIVELYMQALGMAVAPTEREEEIALARAPARTREIIEQFPAHDAETGEIIGQEPQPAPQAVQMPVASDFSLPSDVDHETSLAGAEGIVNRHPIQPEKAAQCAEPARASAVDGRVGEASGGAAPVHTNLPETANEKVGGFPVPAAPLSCGGTGGDGLTENDGRVNANPSLGVTGGESAASHIEGVDLSDAAKVETDRAVQSSSVTAPGVVMETTPFCPATRPRYHEAFPEVNGKDYDALVGSVRAEGVREPIVRMGTDILDGWARYNAARSLGIPYPVVPYRGNDVLIDVIAWQRRDRNFTPAQEKQIAAKLVKAVPHRVSDILAAFDLAEEVTGAE